LIADRIDAPLNNQAMPVQLAPAWLFCIIALDDRRDILPASPQKTCPIRQLHPLNIDTYHQHFSLMFHPNRIKIFKFLYRLV
jgi:hypothetical protein